VESSGTHETFSSRGSSKVLTAGPFNLWIEVCSDCHAALVNDEEVREIVRPVGLTNLLAAFSLRFSLRIRNELPLYRLCSDDSLLF